MRKFNKRMSRSRSGVSDIIANLLILAITVTLFSSIAFYVANMPEPAEATYTDFEPSLSNVQSDDSIWVNVTHKGGQTLKDWTTGIYIFVNGTLQDTLQLADSNIQIGDKWETGEVWSYNVQFDYELTGLSILIVDKDANSIVWQSDLLGGVTNIQLPPIIGSRYTSPSIGLENRSMTIYVQAMDPNGDSITGVYLNLTSLGLGNNNVMENESKNLWSFTIDRVNSSWDNRQITITATDHYGRSDALMRIYVNPNSGGNNNNNNYYEINDTEFDENFYINGLQGFAIFEQKDWDKNHLNANRTNVFNKMNNDDAVVVMISKLVVNTNGENEILVMNQSTKINVLSVSSPLNEFDLYKYVSGYYIYNCTIQTETLQGNYSVSATITDSKPYTNTFSINSWIYVLTTPGDAGYPKMITYSDSDYTNICTNFSVSNSSLNKIYLEVQTSLNSSYISNSGNIEIRDFTWGAQVKSTPATPTRTITTGDIYATNWNGPVSNVWQNRSGSIGIYRLVINLANCTSGAEWWADDNAYILRFDVFKTAGEGYILNAVINIDAPNTKYDIVAGTKIAGGGNWAGQAALFYFTNDNSWTPPEVLETTADRTVSGSSPYLLKAGDIDGNGLGDFVAILATGKVVGGDLQAASTVVNPTIFYSTSGGFVKVVLPALGINTKVIDLYMDLGNIDEDDDLDFVLSYSGGVYIYRNDGAWTKTTIATGVTEIKGVRLADMDPPGTTGNDPLRSMDIVVVTSASIDIWQNSDAAGNYNSGDKISMTAASGSTIVTDFAISEITLEGSIASGDYTSTRSEISQLNYEMLYEETVYNTVGTYPKGTGPGNTMGYPIDPTLSDLYNQGDGDLYSIQTNGMMNITLWDNTYLDLPKGEITVTMTLNYSATFVDDTAIEWFNTTSGMYEELVSITNGVHYLEVPLTQFTSAIDLMTFNVRFNNTNILNPGTLNIDIMTINITYQQGDSLNHVWTFEATAGDSYYFNLFTAINASADGDTFTFQYSKDQVNWNNIKTVTNTGLMTSITPFSLGSAIDGTVYIRVIDTNTTTSTPSNDWIKVGQMYIECTATLTKVGKSIQKFDIADVNGDGFNDIVVCSVNATKVGKLDAGDVWVLYNRYYATGGGIFRNINIKPVITLQTAIGTGVQSIEAARFFGGWNDAYLDIVIGVGTTASVFYGIDQTSLGSFSGLNTLSFLSGMNVNRMLAEDIDGNNRCDLLFGTSDGQIILWANYGGTLVTTYTAPWNSVTYSWAGYTWQRYLITDMEEPIYDMSAGGVC